VKMMIDFTLDCTVTYMYRQHFSTSDCVTCHNLTYDMPCHTFEGIKVTWLWCDVGVSSVWVRLWGK